MSSVPIGAFDSMRWDTDAREAVIAYREWPLASPSAVRVALMNARPPGPLPPDFIELRFATRLLELSERLWRSAISGIGQGKARVLSDRALPSEQMMWDVLIDDALTCIDLSAQFRKPLASGDPFNVDPYFPPRVWLARELFIDLPEYLPADIVKLGGNLDEGLTGWGAANKRLQRFLLGENVFREFLHDIPTVAVLATLIDRLEFRRGDYRSAPKIRRTVAPQRRRVIPDYVVAQRLYWEQRGLYEDRRDKAPTDDEFRQFLGTKGYQLGENLWNRTKKEWREDQKLFWPPPLLEN